MLAEILSSQGDATVVDMEAGLEHLSRAGGTLAHVDQLLIIVEPYAKAIETARRTISLASELGIPRISAVASKVRDAEEQAAVEDFCAQAGLELMAIVPYDDGVRLADRLGLPAIEVAADGPMVRAVEGLASRLQEIWARPAAT